MAYYHADRVWETTTTSGNGAIALAGAKTGYTSFGSGLPPANSGDIVAAVCVTDGTFWEVLLPTWSSGKLSKTVVTSCSGTGGITWPDNSSKDVFCGPFASGLKAIGGAAVSAPYSLASGVIGANNMASGSILSGAIASGQLGFGHLANNSVQSGTIASGQIGRFHIASGAINSGHVADNAVNSGNIASGAIGRFHHASGVINSGHVADNAINSGNVASGQLSQFHLANAAVNSGNVASGQLSQFHLANAAVNSGNIASGQLGDKHFSNASVKSGHIASGQIALYHQASGLTGQLAGPFVSGSAWTITTEETISGLRAVQISQSGKLRVAMASMVLSGRIPAIGIVWDNVASGIQANVYTAGVFQATSGMADYSGYLGKQLFVGRSGHIVTTSGSFNSGGLVSGDIWQPVGYALNSGSCVFSVAAQNQFTMVSG